MVTRAHLHEPRVSVLESASRADASGFTTPRRVAKGTAGGRYPLRVSARSHAAASDDALARVDVVFGEFSQRLACTRQPKGIFHGELAASWAISPGFFRLTDLHRFKEVDLVSNASGVLTRR